MILRCRAKGSGPFELKIAEGKKVADIMGSTLLALVLSDRAVNTLQKEGLSGWKKYPAHLYDSSDKKIAGSYWLLGITGRAGPLDAKKSVTEWFTEEDGTKSPLSMKGIYFDAMKWDGSDFFLLEDFNAKLVTGRVVAGLKAAKLSGWEAVALSDYEM